MSDMDPETGHFPADWCCVGCGKQLNADGNHPAETYAGTYNGLCYPCTSKGPFIVGQRVIDSGVVWSYPPHCPSWRRDRESKVFYWDCPTCGGYGKRDHHVGYGTVRCDTCSHRAYSTGPQHESWEWRRRAREAAQARFERRLIALCDLPKRASEKRQQEAIKALDPAAVEHERLKVHRAHARVVGAITRRGERRHTFTRLSPMEVISLLIALVNGGCQGGEHDEP